MLPGLIYCMQQAAAARSELITLEEMDPMFTRKARALGIFDMHYAVFPQCMHLAGVRSQRVDPTGSSRRCRCGRSGIRQGGVLLCPVHGAVDADANAAVNLRAARPLTGLMR